MTGFQVGFMYGMGTIFALLIGIAGVLNGYEKSDSVFVACVTGLIASGIGWVMGCGLGWILYAIGLGFYMAALR